MAFISVAHRALCSHIFIFISFFVIQKDNHQYTVFIPSRLAVIDT